MPSRCPLCAASAVLALGLALSPVARAATDEEAAYLRMTLPDEELVESATRSPKPLTQIAENVTVVTAEEIEAMNAHTLAEVLNRVTGVFVNSLSDGYWGSIAHAHIQGSGETDFWTFPADERHVTLLLDGMPWNQASANAAALDTVPVGVVDRIEVVKGPASSTWGSSLGGVINVITKKAGTSAAPTGQASLSYGERRAYDGRAEAAGAVGTFGYYLAGEAQGADWERRGAEYRARSLFGKLQARPSEDLTATLTLLASRPRTTGEEDPEWPAVTDGAFRSALASLAVDARLSPAVTLHANGYVERLRQWDESVWTQSLIDTDDDGVPDLPAVGELLAERTYDDRNRGAQAHLTWAAGSHTLVAGVEYFRGREVVATTAGLTMQLLQGALPTFDSSRVVERAGVYLNDTLRLGPLSLTPGLRYDDNTAGGSFWSPSLGGVLRVSASTLLRAQVARGFTAPPLGYVAGAGQLEGADLEPERVWSWQGGVESSAVPGLLLKVTGFRHEVRGSIETVLRPDPELPTSENAGRIWRTGLEAEAETAPLLGFSARGGFAWVKVDRFGEDPGSGIPRREQDIYQANAALSYRRGSLRADLLGHFVWWDLGPGSDEGDKHDWVWDLAGSKGVARLGPADLELFGAAHNLFNSRQYLFGPNPSRWVEAGARIRF